MHHLQLLQVASSCQEEHVTKVTKSLRILLWSLLKMLVLTHSTLEVFCDANTTDKSIIPSIPVLRRSTLISAYFIPPAC